MQLPNAIAKAFFRSMWYVSVTAMSRPSRSPEVSRRAMASHPEQQTKLFGFKLYVKKIICKEKYHSCSPVLAFWIICTKMKLKTN